MLSNFYFIFCSLFFLLFSILMSDLKGFNGLSDEEKRKVLKTIYLFFLVSYIFNVIYFFNIKI